MALLILPVVSGQEQEKPRCSAELQGQYWPLEANHDPAVLAKATRCGELELCTRGAWRYRWRSLSVRLDQLAKNAQMAKPAACMAEVESRDRKASSVPPDGKN